MCVSYLTSFELTFMWRSGPVNPPKIALLTVCPPALLTVCPPALLTVCYPTLLLNSSKMKSNSHIQKTTETILIGNRPQKFGFTLGIVCDETAVVFREICTLTELVIRLLACRMREHSYSYTGRNRPCNSPLWHDSLVCRTVFFE